MREYAAYEYSPAVADDVVVLANVLETPASLDFQKQPVEAGMAQRAAELAESIHTRLPDWARRS